jgi:hypothetical protein
LILGGIGWVAYHPAKQRQGQRDFSAAEKNLPQTGLGGRGAAELGDGFDFINPPTK